MILIWPVESSIPTQNVPTQSERINLIYNPFVEMLSFLPPHHEIEIPDFRLSVPIQN